MLELLWQLCAGVQPFQHTASKGWEETFLGLRLGLYLFLRNISFILAWFFCVLANFSTLVRDQTALRQKCLTVGTFSEKGMGGWKGGC